MFRWRTWRRHVMEVVAGGVLVYAAARTHGWKSVALLTVGGISWLALLDRARHREDAEDELPQKLHSHRGASPE